MSTHNAPIESICLGTNSSMKANRQYVYTYFTIMLKILIYIRLSETVIICKYYLFFCVENSADTSKRAFFFYLFGYTVFLAPHMKFLAPLYA